jgi:hypothetical protein
VQYKQQANPLLLMRLLISKNDKNKPITLLSQHKPEEIMGPKILYQGKNPE